MIRCRTFWFVLPLVGGCVGWDRGDALEPVSRVPGVDGSVWAAEVGFASDTWRAMMAPDCYPFHMAGPGEDGNDVTLVPRSTWTRPTAAGHSFDSGRIDVVGDSPFGRRAVLMHEIGHAMGLGHSPNPSSIMYFGPGSATEPNHTDVWAAEGAAGCR